MNENEDKKSICLKRYFRNLARAVAGTDPFRAELDELEGRYEKTAEKVGSLTELYYSALDRWHQADVQMRGLQVLTENLRDRIAEKDRLIRALQEELDRK